MKWWSGGAEKSGPSGFPSTKKMAYDFSSQIWLFWQVPFLKGFNDYETSCHVLQVSVSVAFDEFQKNMFGFCYSESAVRFGQQ